MDLALLKTYYFDTIYLKIQYTNIFSAYPERSSTKDKKKSACGSSTGRKNLILPVHTNTQLFLIQHRVNISQASRQGQIAKCIEFAITVQEFNFIFMYIFRIYRA